MALVTAINSTQNATEPANISLQLHLLEQTIRNETQILADDTALPFSIKMPGELAVLRSQMLTLDDYAHDTRGYTIVIKTILPAETKLLSFNFPTLFKAVSLAIAKPNSPAWLTLINAGERSQAFPVQGNSVPETLESEPLYSILMSNYLKLGFFHILPHGLDHILFIVGLFLLNPSWRPLLAQATAFTLAHSITLGLAAAGIFHCLLHS